MTSNVAELFAVDRDASKRRVFLTVPRAFARQVTSVPTAWAGGLFAGGRAAMASLFQSWARRMLRAQAAPAQSGMRTGDFCGAVVARRRAFARAAGHALGAHQWTLSDQEAAATFRPGWTLRVTATGLCWGPPP